jgi:hypothetical protein
MIIDLTLCERGKRRKQRKKGKKIGDIRSDIDEKILIR